MVPRPLLVLLGATGCGKTRLSLQLARRHAAELISADSMQLYKGLDIITAKATAEERSMAPHHIIDILQPHQTYTVLDFRNNAIKIIDDLFAKEKMPIVVGGTIYYIESILWKILVEDIEISNTSSLISERDDFPNKKRKILSHENDLESHSVTKDEVDLELEDFSDQTKLSNEELHSWLKKLDPDMAERLHPNDRRKVLRSLQVYVNTGRTHSSVLEEQRSQEGGSGLGGPLRYPSSIILWLHCDQNVLDQRLSDRVDSMLEEGLVKELTDFHEKYNKQRIIDGQKADYTKGVFQSIGFKEFHDYLVLNEEDRNTERGQKLFNESLINLKIATNRYAKRQIKMIKNRLLGYPNRKVPPIYKLDTTDISKWDINVTEKAFAIIDSFISGTECPFQEESFSISRSCEEGINPNVSHFCETCQRVFIGDFQYKIHIKSNKHKKALKRKQRKALKAGDNNEKEGSSL